MSAPLSANLAAELASHLDADSYDAVLFNNTPLASALRADVLRGLSAQLKAIPARWLYDRHGSELFEAITHLPEYYPTRIERAILENNAAAIAERIGPPHAVIEFGSGSSSKTPILLAAISPLAYVPIDISAAFLYESTITLAGLFPELPMHPVVGDFTQALSLPPLGSVPQLGFFPGSTIGNLLAPAATNLLRSMATTLGAGSKLLIGFDRIKPVDILIPAYNDAKGITAKFNLNLLHRINRELDGNMPLDAFRHAAIWNQAETRIEMHLLAMRDIVFSVAGHEFSMQEGESIHTENSLKYSAHDMRNLLHAGGWKPIQTWHDSDEYFSIMLAEYAADVGSVNP